MVDKSVKAMLSMKIDDNLNFKTSNNINDVKTGTVMMNHNDAGSLYKSNDNVNALYRAGDFFGAYDFWERRWYPDVIIKEYPVYIQHRAEDKGKQAFEIIKMMKDAKFLHLDTVGDFIDCMDKLIKIL